MTRVLSLGAFALSVIALAVVLFGGSGGSSDPDQAATVASASETDNEEADARASAEAKIAALEWTVASLVSRVTALEQGNRTKPASAGELPGAAAPAGSAQLEALRSDVDALLTGEPLESEKGRARLKEIVKSVQDEMFAERIQQREAARAQERNERFKRFVEQAHLTSTQAESLTRLLDAEAEQRRALREQRRDGVTERGERGAQIRALRQQTDESAKQLLDAEQFAKYEELRREGRSDHRGGPGPGAGGGGGRGGQVLHQRQ